MFSIVTCCSLCSFVFFVEEERLGTRCCRLRDVVHFVSFSRCDCSGCRFCLELLQIVFCR